MPGPVARFLCTGDLHLGRYPTRIGSRRDELSVDAVWQNTVTYAVDQQVDAVMLTGDVVDRDNRYYEAFGPLKRGVGRLVSAGIDVYAVAGNHDFDVLPRLAESLQDDRFHLLGRGGKWEVVDFKRNGNAVAKIAGWSFPNRQVTRSPMDSFEKPNSDLPLIGLIHCDLDQTSSTYAPIQRREFTATRATAWLLGHIHRPQLTEEGGTPVLYVGSLQPLHPGEPGAHGPWMMELSRNGRATCEQIPLATLRYRYADIDASEITDEDSFRAAITGGISDDLSSIAEQNDRLRRVVYRVNLTGRTAVQPKLEQFSSRLRNSALEVPSGDAIATIDGFSFGTRPAHDLDALAAEPGPPAVLARLLLQIEKGKSLDEYGLLLKNIKKSMADVEKANAFQPLKNTEGREVDADDEFIRNILHRQGMNLLDQLLSQKPQR